MNNFKEELLSLKEDFLKYKNRNEKLHKYFLLIYFAPPLLLIVILFFFNRDSFENIYVKVSIFFTIVLGVVIHFFFRRLFEGENLKNKDFILSRLKNFKSLNVDSINNKLINDTILNDLKFNKQLLLTIKEIFKDIDVELSYRVVKNDIFWKIIFTQFNIDIDDLQNELKKDGR